MADRPDDIPPTDADHVLAERGRTLVAAAMADAQARAPQALHDALAAPPAGQPARRSRRSRARVLAPGLGLAALAAIVVAVVLPGGSGPGRPAAPTVQQVAAIARQPASAAAPAAVGGSPPVLAARVGRLSFPDWRSRYEWRATGRRDDRVGGRAVTTVSYRYADRPTIAYAIVAGPPVGWGAGRDVMRRGERYRVSASAGRRTVTWMQAGHTCVIDAPSTVSAAELVKLASWA